MKAKSRTHYLALIGIFSALAFAAVCVGRLVPNVQGFLSYDPKDAVVVIAGFSFGLFADVLITVIVALIEMVSISTTGLYGFIMNVISTLAFSLPAVLVYRKNRTAKGAILGLVTGVLSVAAVMLLWNWIITPFYMGIPRSAVEAMLPSVFLPFNLIKGGLNATLSMILYKPLSAAVRHIGLTEPPLDSSPRKYNWILPIISSVALIVFIFLFLLLLRG